MPGIEILEIDQAVDENSRQSKSAIFANRHNSAVLKLGFWSGLVAFVFTMIYVIVQLLQLAGVFHFPYDEILIYGSSLGIVIPLIFCMLALHYFVPRDKKIWTHAAIVFIVIYAVFVAANYVVQLATVIPMKMRGELGTAALLA